MYLYVENFVIILTAASVISISALACLYTSGEGYVVKFYIGISIISVCFGALMGGFLGFTKTNHRLNSFESTICGLLVYLVYNEEITQKYR